MSIGVEVERRWMIRDWSLIVRAPLGLSLVAAFVVVASCGSSPRSNAGGDVLTTQSGVVIQIHPEACQPSSDNAPGRLKLWDVTLLKDGVSRPDPTFDFRKSSSKNRALTDAQARFIVLTDNLMGWCSEIVRATPWRREPLKERRDAWLIALIESALQMESAKTEAEFEAAVARVKERSETLYRLDQQETRSEK